MTMNVNIHNSPGPYRGKIYRRDVASGAETLLSDLLPGHMITNMSLWEGCEIVIKEVGKHD